MMTTAPPCRNQCFRQTGPVISEITGLDSAAAVWLVIVSDLSYISSDHYTLLLFQAQCGKIRGANTIPILNPYCLGKWFVVMRPLNKTIAMTPKHYFLKGTTT